MSDDEFEDSLSWQPTDVSADNVVVPLDRSEDAQFSQQQYNSLEDRLERVRTRINRANAAIFKMKQAIRGTAAQVLMLPEDELPLAYRYTDNEAGGDHSYNIPR